MTARLVILAVLFLSLPGQAIADKIPRPDELGRVVLDNSSTKADMAPVVFDHWLHRTQFTCRICHVDIGFAMEREATEINAELNMQGSYCGACHDGKRVVNEKEVFASCAKKNEYSPEEGKRCARCHSKGTQGERQYEFAEYTKNLPRLSVGRLIDWEKAEEDGLIQPIDYLEGISFQRDPLQAQKDFSIEVTTWASDVIFSHKKHAVWNGCELCHPQIFPSSEQGTVQYSMFQIMRGEYCGACHIRVAFSVWLCHKCHKNPVR